MIRFDVLGRLGHISELVRELKDVYLEELKLGSGTFFENINAFSGCHGFNGMAGALLTNKVLGLGAPEGANENRAHRASSGTAQMGGRRRGL